MNKSDCCNAEVKIEPDTRSRYICLNCYKVCKDELGKTSLYDEIIQEDTNQEANET